MIQQTAELFGIVIIIGLANKFMNNKIFELLKTAFNTTSEVLFKAFSNDEYGNWTFLPKTEVGVSSYGNSNGLYVFCGNATTTSNNSNGYYYPAITTYRTIPNLTTHVKKIEFSFSITSTYNANPASYIPSNWHQYWYVYLGFSNNSNYGIHINYDGVTIMYEDNSTQKIISYNAQGSPRGTINIGVYIDYINKLIEITINGTKYSAKYTKNIKKLSDKRIIFYHRLVTQGAVAAHTIGGVVVGNTIYLDFNASSTLQAPNIIKVTY